MINTVDNNRSDENLSILVTEFLNFYNGNLSDFVTQVQKEDRISVISKICEMVETYDVTLHTNLIDVLENEYNFEYGL